MNNSQEIIFQKNSNIQISRQNQQIISVEFKFTGDNLKYLNLPPKIKIFKFSAKTVKY